MNTKAVRRFTLVDAMVLIAATATGLALSRTWAGQRDGEGAVSGRIVALHWFGGWTEIAYSRVLAPGLPCLVTWTAAVLVLRFRQPRPSLRRLARLPGFLACVFPILIITLRLIRFELWMLLPYHAMRQPPSAFSFGIDAAWTILLRSFPFGAPYEAGMAVGVAWLSLSLAGRWKAEQTWVDRTGRVLGALWLAIVPFCNWWICLFDNWFK